MKKILRSRILIGYICVLLAAMIAFVVVPATMSRQLATITVYAAAMDIEKGVVLTEECIKPQEVLKSDCKDSYITDKAQIIGEVAAGYIFFDDYITVVKLTNLVDADLLDAAIQKGQRFVSITINSLAAGVSGYLAAGDFVSVISYEESQSSTYDKDGFMSNESIKAAYIPDGLDHVQILSIQNDANMKVVPAYELSDDITPEDNISKTVTLIVNDEQMLRLVEAENKGTIHLAFVSRGD